MRSGGDAAATGNEAPVEEQSHKSEMRAALQGDFERLRARRESEGEPAVERSGSAPQVAELPEPVTLPAPAGLSWLVRLRGRR